MPTLSVTVHCGERMIRNVAGRKKLANPLQYPLDLLLMMYVLAERKGAIIHAAGIVLKEKSFVFVGRSGAGKSTLVRQFALADDCLVLSDDRVVIQEAGKGFGVSGTPWGGEAGNAENATRPLAGIFFLRQAPVNQIHRLDVRAAAERLLAAASIPWYDRDVAPLGVSFCAGLAERIPAYELQFRPTVDVVDLLIRHAENYRA